MKSQDKNSSQVNQLRSSAETAGKNAAKGFASVDPVQRKEDAAQRKDNEEAASLKADPAQRNPLDEKEL